MKSETKKEILSWLYYIVSGILIALFLVTFVFRFTIVDGESMLNTLNDKQILYMDKLEYTFGKPKRGDIIVCYYKNKHINCVKRIIALPGETVEIKDGVVLVNDDPHIDEWQGKHDIPDFKKITVPENSYFVMGDNRSNSMDSRTVGVDSINKKEIKGKALFTVFPINKFGKIVYKY